MAKNKTISIGSLTIRPGERLTLALPTPEIYTCARTHIPIHVIHGKKEGPILLVCAAMHGDEMNGIVAIQKILNFQHLKSMSGTLIAIPVLSIYGLIMQNRNLPDRRNLESSFPGSVSGSFASRLAHVLATDIFSLATHCIDLHTGEPHTEKMAQIHTSSRSTEAVELAKMFGAKIVCDTEEKRGLLWLLDREKPIPTIIYEAGEPMRLNKEGIRTGVSGILRVMRSLGMLATQNIAKNETQSFIKVKSWVRSPVSGLCKFFVDLGRTVEKGQLLARISDPFGTKGEEKVLAPKRGVILAKTTLPILNEGDPILEIGEMEQTNSDNR